MSTAGVQLVQLEAGGLVPAKAKVDADATEQVVARTYRHPALGDRLVIRLASDRLGRAEDLAMEFLGFGEPAVTAPLAHQQRRSLGFAAWALTNDPANARFALDLVKRMKAAARLARSKPGHAWDAYAGMAKELGRSARQFLPPFWEEVGRTFKDLGNQTYAGRSLNKSLEAERVHALVSDQARRRDVVLEFVLSGCVAGSALSDYGNDLQNQYAPAEAFAIFRDLCARQTRGGMAPWATMPKDFIKLAKAAGLDANAELERWLEELIETPAMGRSPPQFWKTCSAHCKRIVARRPAFAIALLRHTRPEARFYGESRVGPWLELLEEWGVVDFLWDDGHRGAPPLGEPIAIWFGRIVRDQVPAPRRTLEMLERLAPRLKRENVPLPLSLAGSYNRADSIDIDVLEACLALGIKVDDPPKNSSITFSGWLSADVDHQFRNQDVVASAADERFTAAIDNGLHEALACRGGPMQRGYRQTDLDQRAFPVAAGDRPGIMEIWRRHAAALLLSLEQSGLASFETAHARLAATLWPDTLRLFPDLAERLQQVDPVAMLQRTLHAGVFDEYGLPAFDQAVDKHKLVIEEGVYHDLNVHLTFPNIVINDKVHAYVIAPDGTMTKRELRLPKKSVVSSITVVGDDLAVSYRDESYQGHFHWCGDPSQTYDDHSYNFRGSSQRVATVLGDGSVFLGQQAIRPGDKQAPQYQVYLHDGTRFWRVNYEYDQAAGEHRTKLHEVDPHTGKVLRESVPPWFEETEGTVEFGASELMPAPAGAELSPLGTRDGMVGWKTVRRRDGSFFGVGIDGRRCAQPSSVIAGSDARPVALLNQPGTQAHLPVTTSGGRLGKYLLWDPSGSTVVAELEDFSDEFAHGQPLFLPLHFWHLLRLRDEASSLRLRVIGHDQCSALFGAASADRAAVPGSRRGTKEEAPNPLAHLIPAVKELLPTAPDRMVLGVARIIERAERESAAFCALRVKTRQESTGKTAPAAVVNRQCDVAAALWAMPSYHIYGTEDRVSLSAHLAAAAEFLKGNSPGGDLPRTNYLWFPMLQNLPLRCWQTYWKALAATMLLKNAAAVPWLEFLKFWHELQIAELPGRFDVMDGEPEAAKKSSPSGHDYSREGGAAFSLRNGDDRFIVIENDPYAHNRLRYQILRYSTAAKPEPPPGYDVKYARRVKPREEAGQIAAFVAAAEACEQPPVPSGEELAQLAAQLAASPAEIGLIWMGGLNIGSRESNFLPAELRGMWGWKAAEAGAARQALRNLNDSVLVLLYEAVVAPACAAPFAADRGPVLRSIEKTWKAKMPRRLQLEAALQRRLSSLGKTSRWYPPDHELLLALAADPASHPLLQRREIAITVDKDRTYNSLGLSGKAKDAKEIDAESLRSIVLLVALVHAETPSGHVARGDMPALVRQTTKWLGHTETLLALRSFNLYDMGRKGAPKPSEWLNRHVGKTKSNTKDGTERVDDGLLSAAAINGGHQAFIAFRPAKLKANADLARLQAIVGIDANEQHVAGSDSVPIVATIKSPGFQKLVNAIVAKDVPAGEWAQNPSHTAPQIVAAIAKKNKLSDDAAVLYLQLLALPEPTTANLRAWNGWTAAQAKKAADELVARKLVLEAARARAGRSVFLPGEWSELKAPWLPIERWKLAHLVEYDLTPVSPCPVGGPLVLRPYAELFAAAWQRVVDGDVPRYEEVKRKKKAKR